jgi:phospholipase D1/2
MIYVHSKLMIIDDQFLILGSANLNERSLAGDRDAEICIYLRPDVGQLKACQDKIQGLRKTSWTQHFGILPSSWDSPEKKACSDLCQQQARENWINMAQGVRTDKSHIIAFPFKVENGVFSLEPQSLTAALKYQDAFIFDAETKPAKPKGNGSIIDPQWTWYPPKTIYYVPDKLAE